MDGIARTALAWFEKRPHPAETKLNLIYQRVQGNHHTLQGGEHEAGYNMGMKHVRQWIEEFSPTTPVQGQQPEPKEPVAAGACKE